MRATGIVRRIDELGRVVIPKEIRRTLRIREGRPAGNYTDRDGEVILKKYSPIGEMSSFAKDYTESLFRSLGHIAGDCGPRSGGGGERSAAKGAGRQANLPRAEACDRKPINRCPESAERRKDGGSDDGKKIRTELHGAGHQPDYCRRRSDWRGAADEPRQRGKMGDTELKVAETAAGIVGRQMEQ